MRDIDQQLLEAAQLGNMEQAQSALDTDTQA